MVPRRAPSRNRCAEGEWAVEGDLSYRKPRPCGKHAAALGFALAVQELQGQFYVILGQHFFDGAGLQFLR